MREYYTADVIRAAEAPLLATMPAGTLMRRAAYGLAVAIATELRRRTGGAGGRCGVPLSVRVITAEMPHGRQRISAVAVRAYAILLSPERTHVAALAAFTNAGGRVVRMVPAATDLVIDGVVGISGRGPLL